MLDLFEIMAHDVMALVCKSCHREINEDEMPDNPRHKVRCPQCQSDQFIAKADRLYIDVWDANKREWRGFTVVPYQDTYKVQCRNGLHQFRPGHTCCQCGTVSRTEHP